MMRNELKKVLATPFKKKDIDKISKKSFIFTLALDLNWFSLEEAKNLVDLAISKELLIEEEDGGFVPGFSLEEVDASLSFRPNKDLLREVDENKKDLLNKIISRIQEENDLTKQEIISESNNLQNELFKLIDIEVAALFVANEKDVFVKDLINEKLGSI